MTMCKSPLRPAQQDTLSSLERLECQLLTPRRIAMERMHYLGVSVDKSPSVPNPTEQQTICERRNRDALSCGGLSTLLLSLLQEAHESWSLFFTTMPDASSQKEKWTPPIICNSDQINILQRTLDLLSRVSKMDITLGEEIGRAGSKTICTRLIEQISKLTAAELSDEDSDTLVELQDSAFEVYSLSTSAVGFTKDEMLNRLPLVFNFSNRLTNWNSEESEIILISQVTKRQSAQEDVGFIMWPSAIVLSHWLITNPHVLRDKSVLELGAGCGLVGVTAALIKLAQSQCHEPTQGKVIITDVNELVLENVSQNIRLNNVASVATVAKLDFYSQTGHRRTGGWLTAETGATVAQKECAPVDVILAADIICRAEDAIAASRTIHDALRIGGVAFVVCATAAYRFGVEIFASECEERGLKVIAEKSNVADELDDGERLSLERMMQTAAGYVDGMELTFFRISKNEV